VHVHVTAWFSEVLDASLILYNKSEL
jgi:hypothetical protein